ncbi:MAG: aspartate--tRNA ligase [Candidatus Aureabacteria bacterium]|nr:aspartate--tRNA ligase [Candidatus Auribacterota bacterium]
MENYARTHHCGELRGTHVGSRVRLCGWVHRRRDHGGLVFIDLRDREGITQVVFNPEIASDPHARAEELRSECVIAIAGAVRRRPPGTENTRLATGEVEVLANELLLLARAQTPPFSIESEEEVSEELRLKYRYLDLRRPELQHALKLRHRVMLETRNYFDSKGFLEIETPILTKSTPEGARDYLVPSRTQPGSFFALPQSPQLMKQLLMVAGMDRYFQICKCFRDEDLRADRQPEFTQIDLEMSFAREDDIFSVVEGLMARLFKIALGLEIPVPFARVAHADALARFGTDKPDLRFGMELRDVTEIVRGSRFNAFESVLAQGGRVKGIMVPGGASCSRSALDELTTFAAGHGAKGLAWFKVMADRLESPLVKFFQEEQVLRLREELGGSPAGGLILLVADTLPAVYAPLSALRNRLGRERGLIERTAFRFAWVVDFPLFTYNEEEKRLESEHHPFTSPKREDIPLLDDEPLKARSASYDLVLNGCEIGSGSVRIHEEKLQHKIFELLTLDERVIEERFGFFLEAFRYGAPPHAGFAIGLDRLVMIMAGRETIRDVIGFPKTQKASCLMTGSPSPVSPEQLRELQIRVGQ